MSSPLRVRVEIQGVEWTPPLRFPKYLISICEGKRKRYSLVDWVAKKVRSVLLVRVNNKRLGERDLTPKESEGIGQQGSAARDSGIFILNLRSSTRSRDEFTGELNEDASHTSLRIMLTLGRSIRALLVPLFLGGSIEACKTCSFIRFTCIYFYRSS